MRSLLIDRLKKAKSIRNEDYVVWLEAVNRIAPLTKQRSDAFVYEKKARLRFEQYLEEKKWSRR